MSGICPLETSRFVAVSALLALSGLSCAGGGAGEPTGNNGNKGGGNPAITLSVSPNALLLGRGGTRTLTVTVTRQDYTGSITLSDFTPTGVTGTFNPTTLTGSTLTSTLTLNAALDAALVQLPMVVEANGSDFKVQAFVDLTVYSPPVTVTRDGTGSGTVTSQPAGINCGNTCSTTFSATSVTFTATPASGSVFAGWSGGCNGTTPTCTFSPNAAANNSITATFNSTTPSFSLALTPTSVSVPQGASRTATIDVTRVNGFSGAVTLAVSGVPAGLTVTPNPSSVTGGSATLDVVAALSLAAGSYPITITGTGTGVAQRTVTLTVLVTQSSGGSNNFALSFATCDPAQVPIWFAVQSSAAGAWIRVNPVGTTFTFPVTPGLVLAYVTQAGTTYQTNVRYTSGAEVSALRDVCAISPQVGTKHLTGTVANNGNPGQNYWSVALGGVYLQRDPAGGTNFTLDEVPAGPRDLIAGRVQINGAVTFMQQMIVRRGVNYANNSAIPLLDFAGSEAFAPVPVFFTITNPNGDEGDVGVALLTPRGLSADYYTSAPINTDKRRYFALPSGQVQPGEFHVATISAHPPNDSTKARLMQVVRVAPADETVTLGPTLNPPTFTTVSATTPVRLHTEILSQAEYGAGIDVEYEQADRSVRVFRTAGSAAGTPNKWGLDIPDLGAAGYDPAWGLQGGKAVSWAVFGFGGDIAVFLGGAVTGNAQLVAGVRAGSITP